MSEILLQTAALSVGYEGRTVVSGVAVEVAAGTSLAVIGHNGSGKTTLLRTLFGLQPALSGQASVLALALPSLKPRLLIERGARYLAQGPRSFDELSPSANRDVLSRLYGFQRESRGVNHLPPAGRVGSLSLGWRRLEALELLMAGSPSLLLLDEPTASLDQQNAHRVFEWLSAARRRGVSLVIVEHALTPLLRLTDQCLVIRGGTPSYYGAAEPLKDPARLASVFL
jgi:branched-chain amino acid transport system ATP-binding protein